jgi:hypothetical protein
MLSDALETILSDRLLEQRCFKQGSADLEKETA